MSDKNYCKINDFKRIFNLKYDFIHDLFNRHSKVFLPFFLGRGEKQSMLFELSENLYNEFLNVYHKVIKAPISQYKKPITMTYEDFKAKVLDIRYNTYHDIIWTKDLQMCKDRGCICKGCFYEKFFTPWDIKYPASEQSIHKCTLKKKVMEAIRLGIEIENENDELC